MSADTSCATQSDKAVIKKIKKDTPKVVAAEYFFLRFNGVTASLHRLTRVRRIATNFVPPRASIECLDRSAVLEA